MMNKDMLYTQNARIFKPWQRITSLFTLVFFLFQIPTIAFAQALQDSYIQAYFNSSSQFEPSESGSYQFQPASYLNEVSESYYSIQDFYNRLESSYKPALGAVTYVPISVGDITTIIPIHTTGQYSHVGTPFVQSRYVRAQVVELLGRTLIDPDDTANFGSESQQLSRLYSNAYDYAVLTDGVVLGQKLSLDREASPIDMIWPEVRVINGQQVLVPVVYLNANTVDSRRVDNHITEFDGDLTGFAAITVENASIKFGRDSFIQVVNKLTLNNGTVESEGDLEIAAGGTLQILSSQINSEGDLKIAAHGVEARTLVYRFDYGNKKGSYYDTITSVNAEGDMVIRSFRDITIQGSKFNAGGSMTLDADGSIYVGSVEYQTHERTRNGRWKGTKDSVDYLQSTLTAEDTIELIANSEIVIDAAELISNEGHLNLLAGMGITIESDSSSTRINKKYKKGKKKKTVSAYQTVAIRAALDAGKGVTIHSELGDIKLRAAAINSTEGTSVTAKNGAVHLLMAKELDHYSYHAVSKRMFSTRTVTRGHNIETPVYPSIIGGFQANALYGLYIDYEADEDLSLQEQLDKLEKMEGMEWITEIRSRGDINWQEVELAYETWKTDDTSLNAAAMALISVVAAAALGPGGFAAVMSGGGMVAAAVNAGIAAIATQATISVGNGNSLGETLEGLAEEESLKSVAISMVTAAAMSGISDMDIFKGEAIIENGVQVGEKLSLGQQVGQALVMSAANAGISTVVNGGDLEEFGDSFKTTLMQNAINTIGETLAKEIGIAGRANRIDEAARYIYHAGVGCLTGGATSGINDGDESSGCLSGAGGAVIGEAAADAYKSFVYSGLNSETPKSTLDSYRSLVNLKRDGVHIARVSAALTAFAVGADVDLAASAAGNAAEHNSLGDIIDPMEWLAFALFTTWVLVEGEGNLLIGLHKIKSEGTELGKAISAGTEELIKISYQEYPKQTKAALTFLLKGGELFSEFLDSMVVSYSVCERESSNVCLKFATYSEQLYSSIPEEHKNKIQELISSEHMVTASGFFELATIALPGRNLKYMSEMQDIMDKFPDGKDMLKDRNHGSWGDSGYSDEEIEDLTSRYRNSEIPSIQRYWTDDSIKHVIYGDLNGLKLAGGLHTQQGLERLLKVHSSSGVEYTIEEVESFSSRNDSSSVLMITLPNGVKKVQLPRDVWMKKAFERSSVESPSGRIKGIKTLWPESFTADDIVAASNSVLQKNWGNTSDKNLYGSYKGVEVKVVRDIETGMINTVHPTWSQ